ncbi:cation:proton antiporter family protein [Paenibacillus sp. YYML68]|uniref:cation:proton antiporter family protein n=1 Tax=Paenibacillus sp. YYML68 TaxID=2909250 RepID=UPI00249091F8|nr:cation:proton antiporter family protein [Paenibacillus sp. YYML68]
MEHAESGSITSLILVVLVSFLVPMVLYHLKLRLLPVVVVEIAVGLLIGKSGLNLVGDDPWLHLLSLLGFIYLMFLSGLEIDFSAFKGKTDSSSAGGMKPFSTAVIIFIGIFVVSGLLSLVLSMMGLVDRVFLMTLIIGTISLGVVVPVLKEKGLLNQPLGQTLLLITVLADFVTMIFLAFYVSWLSRNLTKMGLLLLFFVLIYIIYLLIRRFTSKKWFDALSQGTIQFGTRAIFTLILVFVFLSESLGAENILGAFMAGVVVSLLMPKKEFVHQLESFGYGFLIPIFFVMVGVNLELGHVFSDSKVLLLIPLLLFFIFLSKMVPMLVLKRWYPWKQVIGSGVLLSSTLSLVIAASTLALELGIIDEAIHGSLIVVAVLSCLVFPVIFNKLIPQEEPKRPAVSIIGANHISITVAQELSRESDFEVRLFTTSGLESQMDGESGLRKESLRLLSNLSEQELTQEGAFQADIIVLATMDDSINIRIARSLKDETGKRLIVRVEDPQLQRTIQEEGFTVFSTLYAASTVLRAFIEHPSALKLISEHADSMREIVVDNPAYDEVLLRKLPLLADLLILRVYRGESFLIPHGNTLIRRGDRLLVSGQAEQIQAFKKKLK